jgi:uncharacterized protein
MLGLRVTNPVTFDDWGSTMAGKFVLTKSDKGSFHFNLGAANGEVIATSQSYTTKGAAQNGIDAVRKVSADAIVDDQTPRS